MRSGKDNPNYRHGRHVDPRCDCGRTKDYRSKRCAICANRGFPVGGETRWSIEDVRRALSEHDSIAAAARALGLNRKTVTNIVWSEMIDLSHMRAGKGRPSTPDKIFCIKEKRDARTRKYLRLWDPDGYLCTECGQEPEWNGRVLVLQMDHINGNPCDDRRENLRWLCPNCHTQTGTFTGRNARRKEKT